MVMVVEYTIDAGVVVRCKFVLMAVVDILRRVIGTLLVDYCGSS